MTIPPLTTSSSRILTFDLLRGWFLFVITVNHLGLHPTVFDLFTGKSDLWVTAAEGFFFVSGLLIGIVRGGSWIKKGAALTTRKIWSRAGKLYVATVALTLLFTALGTWLVQQSARGIKGGLQEFDSLGELIWQTLSFQYVYGYVDFLNFYTVFLVLAPAVLYLLVSGRWKLVLAIITVLWLIKGFLGTNGSFAFTYLTWQWYFFAGCIAGFHYPQIQRRYQAVSDKTRQKLRYGVVIGALVTIAASMVLTFVPGEIQDHTDKLAAIGLAAPASVIKDSINGVTGQGIYDFLFGNNRGGLLRIGFFALWFSALFLFVRRFESTLRRLVGWLLIPLGANSLYVYIMQSFFVFGIPLLQTPPNFFLNTLINVVLVLVLWLLVRYRVLFGVIPR